MKRRGLVMWRWHRFWVRPPKCRVVMSASSGAYVSWTCSCRKRFEVIIDETRRLP